MRRIAVINQKGGVGKTTSCCNIGVAIASTGRSVLLIDLDPQAHLTMHLGVEPEGANPNLYDVLTDNVPIAEATVRLKDNLHLVPSHIDLAAAEMELVSVLGRERILRNALEATGDRYDFILIDCPPSLGVLTINGLAAMEEVFVPMQPHFLALQGLSKLLETIRMVKERINPELKVSGIILCMYDAGTRLAAEVSSDLGQFLEASRNQEVPWSEAKVFDNIVRRNIKLAECPSHGLSIFDYAASSNGAADYAGLTAEILGVDALPVTPGAGAGQPSAAVEERFEADVPDAVDAELVVREEAVEVVDVAPSEASMGATDDRSLKDEPEADVDPGTEGTRVPLSFEDEDEERDDKPEAEESRSPSSAWRASIPIEYEEDQHPLSPWREARGD